MQVAILGAGGNMGRRITKALLGDGDYVVRHIEPSERGQGLLADLGVTTTELEPGLAGAEVVIFAVPDLIVRTVAADIVPKLDPGTSMLFLDPAAIAADRIPRRADVNCYVTHPTHPPLYSLLAEADAAARARRRSSRSRRPTWRPSFPPGSATTSSARRAPSSPASTSWTTRARRTCARTP